MARTPTKKLPAPPAAPVLKKDTWSNAATGFGVLGQDKRLNVSYSPDLLDTFTAEALWRGNALAARIVEIIPDEMLREGWEVCVTENKDLSEVTEDAGEDLGICETLRSALHTARALGGSAILVGANDGSDNLELPLAEDRIRSIDYLNVLSPMELWPVKWYSDPVKAKYGEVATYRVVPSGIPPGADVSKFPIVHESRLIRFNGIRTTRRFRFTGQRPGWDDSVLGRVIETLSDFQAAWQGAGLLVTDFSTPVLKLKNLAQLLATDDGQAIFARASGIEAGRSIARVTILDSEETFERQSTNVSGLPELLEKFMLRLAADAKMPVSLLMGQAPAGLNATGDSDVRWFYDQIAAERERVLRPALERFYKLVFLAKNGPSRGVEPEAWDIEFNPLWQLTEQEQANVRKTQAETDSIYLAAKVVTPEEIAKSRFGGDGYSTVTQIDGDLRDALLADTEAQKAALSPAPAPATGPILPAPAEKPIVPA